MSRKQPDRTGISKMPEFTRHEDLSTWRNWLTRKMERSLSQPIRTEGMANKSDSVFSANIHTRETTDHPRKHSLDDLGQTAREKDGNWSGFRKTSQPDSGTVYQAMTYPNSVPGSDPMRTRGIPGYTIRENKAYDPVNTKVKGRGEMPSSRYNDHETNAYRGRSSSRRDPGVEKGTGLKSPKPDFRLSSKLSRAVAADAVEKRLNEILASDNDVVLKKRGVFDGTEDNNAWNYSPPGMSDPENEKRKKVKSKINGANGGYISIEQKPADAQRQRINAGGQDVSAPVKVGTKDFEKRLPSDMNGNVVPKDFPSNSAVENQNYLVSMNDGSKPETYVFETGALSGIRKLENNLEEASDQAVKYNVGNGQFAQTQAQQRIPNRETGNHRSSNIDGNLVSNDFPKAENEGSIQSDYAVNLEEGNYPTSEFKTRISAEVEENVDLAEVGLPQTAVQGLVELSQAAANNIEDARSKENSEHDSSSSASEEFEYDIQLGAESLVPWKLNTFAGKLAETCISDAIILVSKFNFEDFEKLRGPKTSEFNLKTNTDPLDAYGSGNECADNSDVDDVIGEDEHASEASMDSMIESEQWCQSFSADSDDKFDNHENSPSVLQDVVLIQGLDPDLVETLSPTADVEDFDWMQSSETAKISSSDAKSLPDVRGADSQKCEDDHLIDQAHENDQLLRKNNAVMGSFNDELATETSHTLEFPELPRKFPKHAGVKNVKEKDFEERTTRSESGDPREDIDWQEVNYASLPRMKKRVSFQSVVYHVLPESTRKPIPLALYELKNDTLSEQSARKSTTVSSKRNDLQASDPQVTGFGGNETTRSEIKDKDDVVEAKINGRNQSLEMLKDLTDNKVTKSVIPVKNGVVAEKSGASKGSGTNSRSKNQNNLRNQPVTKTELQKASDTQNLPLLETEKEKFNVTIEANLPETENIQIHYKSPRTPIVPEQAIKGGQNSRKLNQLDEIEGNLKEKPRKPSDLSKLVEEVPSKIGEEITQQENNLQAYCSESVPDEANSAATTKREAVKTSASASSVQDHETALSGTRIRRARLAESRSMQSANGLHRNSEDTDSVDSLDNSRNKEARSNAGRKLKIGKQAETLPKKCLENNKSDHQKRQDVAMEAHRDLELDFEASKKNIPWWAQEPAHVAEKATKPTTKSTLIEAELSQVADEIDRNEPYTSDDKMLNFTSPKLSDGSSDATNDDPKDERQRRKMVSQVPIFREPKEPLLSRKDTIADIRQSGNIEDTIYNLFKNDKGTVNVDRFIQAVQQTGIDRSDYRLKEMVHNMQKISRKQHGVREPIESLVLTKEQFQDCIQDNIVIITKILRNKMVIPDWELFCEHIREIYDYCAQFDEGQNAQYIEQLARVDPSIWALTVCTVDGQRFHIGRTEEPMCIQSCSKVLNYAKALQEIGADKVHQFVGQEPSGRNFNELALDHNSKPHNPLINSGAIVISSLVEMGLPHCDRYDKMLKYYRRIAGGLYVGFNNAVFLSERATADRNYALAYFMRENKCFPPGTDLNETLDLYFQLCSVELTTNSAAVMAATLANGGICPVTDDPVLNSASVRDVLSLMLSCGMYDYSGHFAFNIGLPAKSGVSGLILLVVPNVMGIALWSPRLDRYGNSVRGVKFCEELVKRFNFHNYDNLRYTEKKQDPRQRAIETHGQLVVNLLFSAANGDVTALRRYKLRGVDLGIADYDSRTALHLAAAEGHDDCVRFLLHKAHVKPDPKDRWGHTPIEEAANNGHQEIVAMLRDYVNGVEPEEYERQNSGMSNSVNLHIGSAAEESDYDDSGVISPGSNSRVGFNLGGRSGHGGRKVSDEI